MKFRKSYRRAAQHTIRINAEMSGVARYLADGCAVAEVAIGPSLCAALDKLLCGAPLSEFHANGNSFLLMVASMKAYNAVAVPGAEVVCSTHVRSGDSEKELSRGSPVTLSAISSSGDITLSVDAHEPFHINENATTEYFRLTNALISNPPQLSPMFGPTPLSTRATLVDAGKSLPAGHPFTLREAQGTYLNKQTGEAVAVEAGAAVPAHAERATAPQWWCPADSLVSEFVDRNLWGLQQRFGPGCVVAMQQSSWNPSSFPETRYCLDPEAMAYVQEELKAAVASQLARVAISASDNLDTMVVRATTVRPLGDATSREPVPLLVHVKIQLNVYMPAAPEYVEEPASGDADAAKQSTGGSWKFFSRS